MAVSNNGVPQVTLFVEARLERNAEGRIVSVDRKLAGDAWFDQVREIDGLVLAARVPQSGNSNGEPLVGIIAPLPYYVGLVSLLRALPGLLRGISRVVDQSDVVCVKLPGVVGMIAVCVAAQKKKLIAAQIVGDIEDVLKAGIAGTAGKFAAPLARDATRWCIRRAQLVRYVTQTTLQRRYPASFGATTLAFSDVAIDSLLPARESPEAGLIVAVGTQEQLYKGHHVLLAAVEKLSLSHPSIRVELIGDGRYQLELKALAAKAGLSERVDFIGYISDWNTLRSHLDRAEIFVLPSLTEGLPRALIEAMSRGLPCIASGVGGIPELLDKVVLCPPGDSSALAQRLVTMLDNPSFRAEQGARNLVQAGTFSAAGMETLRREWCRSLSTLANSAHSATFAETS